MGYAEISHIDANIMSYCGRVNGRSRSGGAGGGTRTHKGLRPEMCEISAFTGFATPAPFRLRTPAIPKAETRHPTRAAAHGGTMQAGLHGCGARNTRGGAKPRGLGSDFGGAVCFVNPRPERARSALCAPLQGAPSRRARAVSPGNPLRARYVGYGEARGETEESVLMERRSGEAAVG